MRTNAITRAPALLLAAVLAVSPAAWAAVPGTVAVEGVLHGAGGGPVVDGAYDVTFLLYAQAQGGQALWSEPAKLAVKAGAFAHVLGQAKPVAAAVQQGGAWLALQVATEPELPRKALHAVPFAMRAGVAEGLDCVGCLGGTTLKLGSLDPALLSFNYAGSDSKGGTAFSAKAADFAKMAGYADKAGAADTATMASSLKCSGCVTVAHMKFDADVDAGANNIKTTGTVAAGKFVGDGSALTGIKIAKGTCKPGAVVTNVAADGTLECAALFENGKVGASLLPFEKGDLLAPEDRPLVKGLAGYGSDYLHLAALGDPVGLAAGQAANVKKGVKFGPANAIVGTHEASFTECVRTMSTTIVQGTCSPPPNCCKPYSLSVNAPNSTYPWRAVAVCKGNTSYGYGSCQFTGPGQEWNSQSWSLEYPAPPVAANPMLVGTGSSTCGGSSADANKAIVLWCR